MPNRVLSDVQRLPFVDALRGFAVALMIVFHFCYDLRYFGWVPWDVPNGEFWWQFRYLILSLFIGTLGASLSLAHGSRVIWRSFFVRALKLFLAGMLVIVMSLVMFPQSWIYFGILQFLLVASFVGVFLATKPWLSAVFALLVFFLYFSGILDSSWPFSLVDVGLPSFTEDYVPLFPWLGVVFFGISIGHWFGKNAVRISTLPAPRWLVWLGKNALIIYLIHQPLLFAILTPISML